VWLEIPFVITNSNVGARALPSFGTKHSANVWLVEGVVARRLAPDLHVRLPLNVYSAGPRTARDARRSLLGY
jgi:hypothetical protein